VRGLFTRVASRTWFRALVAVAFVALHVVMLREMGAERFHRPFNLEPDAAPAFGSVSEPMSGDSPAHWDRLVAARWDSQHYEGLALRGFSQCPKRDLRGANLAQIVTYCDFSFYPGYPLLGRLASDGGAIPIDYALFFVSLVASVVFLFLWTSAPIREALSTEVTYLSLLLFNVFPTGFDLATIQTEPCVLACTLGSIVAMARRRYLATSLLAGAATGLRISGAATGAACGVAIVASLWLDRPRTRSAWVARTAAIPLAAWGTLAIMIFFSYRYSDPLLYLHAHDASYHWLASTDVWDRFDSEFIFSTINQGYLRRQEGILIAACLLWLALGMRRAVAGFGPIVQVQLWALTIVGAGVSLFGSWAVAFAGMNRYGLIILPLFFGMAQVLRRAPAALVLWVGLSSWAYWNVDLCDYVGEGDDASCHFVR
jgi:hypothetical protein